MLTLYIKPGCPYCAKALMAVAELDLEVEEKNIESPGITDELLARGGKVQTPYLIDDETGTELYESKAIVEYLHEHFGKNKVDSGVVTDTGTCQA